ncbi:MAG: histidine phosphatase family protein, partial [Megasphaera elsdenii]|nr:histidine phosphatase family protein [Megasphaera elsdenii]
MVRIILIRHGETQWNIEGRYQGQEDTHLSERGQLQGRMVADGLKNTPIDVAISSPLERSYMTCSFCAALHGLTVLKDDRLLEINHG